MVAAAAFALVLVLTVGVVLVNRNTGDLTPSDTTPPTTQAAPSTTVADTPATTVASNLLTDEETATIDGLVVFCGDRHWQYASVDETTGVWEFGCGPGSEKHQLGWKKGDKRPVHQFLRVAGGFLSGEVSVKDGDAKLAIRHHDVYGEQKSEFVFPQPSN